MKTTLRKDQLILTVCFLLTFFLLFGYVTQAQSKYDARPSAEGQLKDVSFSPRSAIYPGDGVPLYPADVKWEAVSGFTTNDFVDAVAVSGESVYVGGYFSSVGGQSANNIARWDGSHWYPLGTGLDGAVYTIAVSGNNVYVGGIFTHAGGQVANRIARWDGSQWYPLGSGLNSAVNSIGVNDSDVYVGGYFTQAGGQPAARIARWDGSAWHPLGSGVPGTSQVLDLALNESDVYIGGYITPPGSYSIANVARWDGSSWYPLGTGIEGNNVTSLLYHNGSLYAGGHFDYAGGLLAMDFARWNGSAWQDTGLYVGSRYYRSTVIDIAAGMGGVYAVGLIDHAPVGTSFANGIACYNGSQWSNLGSGLTSLGSDSAYTAANNVTGVGASGSRVYAVGDFTYAGNKTSPGFAVWHNTPELAISYTDGAPGSIFAITGRYFPPYTFVQIEINGQEITSGSYSDMFGVVHINLFTLAQANTGDYIVSMTADGSRGFAGYQLAAEKPVRTLQDDLGLDYGVPPEIPAFTNKLFLPTTRR